MFFLLLMLAIGVNGCDWLEQIQERRVDFEIVGEGLHRWLEVNTRLGSLQRFSECRMLYELIIPSGAYVDMDSVNSSMSGHSFFSKHRFDVEAPAHQSDAHKVLIFVNQTIRRSFVIEDRFTLPVRIRYHSATDDEDFRKASVVFSGPAITLDCNLDFEPLKLATCRGKRLYLDYGLLSRAPNWVLVEPLSKSARRVSIPVGDSRYTNIVLAGTGGAIACALALLMSGTSINKAKSE